LREQGVGSEYVELLQLLYEHQTATVLAGTESEPFTLTRGVKQGDPISALLFIVVMESVFRKLKARWASLNEHRSGSYYGVVVDSVNDPLTNLRFADDILLIATCKADVARMLRDLKSEASKYGLSLHMGKTIVLTNSSGAPDAVECEDVKVKVACPADKEKYLGRKLCTEDFHEVELANRLASGWASFMKLKEVLCDKRISLRKRLRLFDAVVVPTVLYGCAAWTLTADGHQQLTVARRRMLRWIFGLRRGSEETWVDYTRRATRHSVIEAEKYGSKDWATLCREKKWKFAGLTATRDDGRWSRRLLMWNPWFRITPWRRPGRPLTRWDDEISRLAGGDWTNVASDHKLWASLCHAFSRSM